MLYILHNLPGSFPLLPTFPLFLLKSLHSSKDTFTESLSPSCWHKFGTCINRRLYDANAQRRLYLAKGNCCGEVKWRLTDGHFFLCVCLIKEAGLFNGNGTIIQMCRFHHSVHLMRPVKRRLERGGGAEHSGSEWGPVTVTQIHWCAVERAVSHVRLLLHWLAAERRLPWQQAAGRQRSESQEDGVGRPSAFDRHERLARR